MRRNPALLVGAAVGAVLAMLLRRRPRRPLLEAPARDPRAEELRRRLAEARESVASEDDFEAAGMGPETVAAEEEPPPGDEFEAMRRRIHAEGKRAAEEMRRRSDSPDA